jgi:predicted transposase YdaD
LEPSNWMIHRALLESGQVRRVYLDELGDLRQQPLEVGLMLLTTIPEAEAVEAAQYLVEQARQQSEPAIIDLIATIILYKFSNLSREEIAAMLGLITEEPRAIREAKEEAERKLILRLLNKQVGKVSDSLLSQIQALSLEQVEALAEALLDFSTIADLEGWLNSQKQE